jgi:hypothetical protein
LSGWLGVARAYGASAHVLRFTVQIAADCLESLTAVDGMYRVKCQGNPCIPDQ